MFLYFVVKVNDEKIGKVKTRVNGWLCFWWLSICEFINCLVLLFTGS